MRVVKPLRSGFQVPPRAGGGALQRPSLEAMTPRLVERHELPAAAALSSLRMNIGMVAGPAIASARGPPRAAPRRAGAG
ncbi:MAG: MFS transporter [Polyangiaceae bacterium]|nr:MFS transporter [Polyangiaceae bacterium]